MVYQDLTDLQAACASAGPSPATRTLEVGLFSGDYITPVDAGYLEHLEHIRNRSKHAEVQERARAAVINGSAEVEDYKIATGVRGHFEKGADGGGLREMVESMDLNRHDVVGGGDQEIVARQQDISLDNLNDHEG